MNRPVGIGSCKKTVEFTKCTLRDLWTETEQLAAYVALISDAQTRDWTRDILWINRLPSRLRDRFIPIVRLNLRG